MNDHPPAADAPGAADAPRPAGATRWLRLLGRIAVTVVAAGVILRRVDPGQALDLLRAAPWWAFAAPVAFMGGNAVVQGVRFQLLLRAGGVALPLPRVVRILLQAIFMGQVLPKVGAGVTLIAWLRRDTGRTDVVLGALVIARFFEVFVMTLLLLYALWWGVGGRWPWVGASAGMFAAAFSAFIVLSLAASHLGERIVRWVPIARAQDHVRAFGTALKAIGGDGRRLALAGALTLPLSAGNIAAAWVALHAYGLTLPLSDALALVPAMDSVILLPITVSGVGLREGVFVYVLRDMGVTEAAAVAMALTRWTGELGRSALGGVLFLLDGKVGVRQAPSRGGGSATGEP